MMFLRFVRLLIGFAPVFAVLPLAALPALRGFVAIRITHALERNGATFIKLGQIASSRPDLVPPKLVEALSRLQDQAVAHSYEESVAIIESAFNTPMDEIFHSFGHTPIASGSIAQVHKATLNDGRVVAVKVRHPGLENTVAVDVSIIEFFANWIGKLPTLKWLDLGGSARNFGDTVRGQLNLHNEAENLETFRQNFADQTEIVFPTPYMEWVSPTVLVESFEEGIPLSQVLKNPDYPHKIALSRQGLKALMAMIFRDGFVHADLHPGNLLVRTTDDGPQTIVLDTGMVATMQAKDRANYGGFFLALSQYDAHKAADMMVDNAPYHDCKDRESFAKGLDAIFEQVRHLPLNEVEVSKVLAQVMQLVRTHRIGMESAFTSVNVGIMVLEGVGRQMDPDLNILEVAAPMLMQFMGASAAA